MWKQFQILTFAFLILLTSAAQQRSIEFADDLTTIFDFSNEFFHDGDRLIIFGSYSAHLISGGKLPHRDIDIIQVGGDGQDLDLHNRTVIQFHGETIDLKVGRVSSLDALIKEVNINAAATAIEFVRHGKDDIELVDFRRAAEFDNFLQDNVMRILDSSQAVASDCIRLLTKAYQKQTAYVLTGKDRGACEKPAIVTSESAERVKMGFTAREFPDFQVFRFRDDFVWATDEASASAFYERWIAEVASQKRRRWLSWEFDFPFVNGYHNLGRGKCKTWWNTDPSYKYYHGIGEEACRLECDADSDCWGWSCSSYGNCLHWTEPLIKGGGANWGGAECHVADHLNKYSGPGRRALEEKDSSEQEKSNVKLQRRRMYWHSSVDEDSADSSCGSSNGYNDLCSGKCQTTSGGDPAHMYYHGVGEDSCRSKCDSNSDCWGYSFSNYDNCLLWLQSNIVGGGDSWGGAHCHVQINRRQLAEQSTSDKLAPPRRKLRDDVQRTQGFYDIGSGKCLTSALEDPNYNYLHGIGEDSCRAKCDEDSNCYGFSSSKWGNCLHWLDSDLVEGGSPWGGARCHVKQLYTLNRGLRRRLLESEN